MENIVPGAARVKKRVITPAKLSASDRLNRIVIKKVFRALGETEDDQEIATLVRNTRIMLAQNGSSLKKLGDELARTIEFQVPTELEPETPLNPTTAKLILQRHRRALGLGGEVVLSDLLAKLNGGQPISRDDLANFRKVQATARLALEEVTV